MIVIIEARSLQRSINRIQGALIDKSLAEIIISAVGTNSLSIHGIDRTTGIQTTVPAKVIEKHSQICIPAKIFSEIVKELPPTNITLSSTGEESTLVISSDAESSFSMSLPLVKKEQINDFPVCTTKSLPSTIKADVLATMIEQINFCISHDSSRNFGSVGLLKGGSDGSLQLVGTDGFRLSIATNKTTNNFSEEVLSGVCIPKKALLELLKICQDDLCSDINITVVDKGCTLHVSSNTCKAVFLLSSVEFPDYKGAIPAHFIAEATFPLSLLRSVVRRGRIASNQSGALCLELQANTLTVSAKNPGRSEGREKIVIDGYTSHNGKFVLNGKFLSEALVSSNTDRIRLCYTSGDEPIMLVPCDVKNDVIAKHVLVPISDN